MTRMMAPEGPREPLRSASEMVQTGVLKHGGDGWWCCINATSYTEKPKSVAKKEKVEAGDERHSSNTLNLMWTVGLTVSTVLLLIPCPQDLSILQRGLWVYQGYRRVYAQSNAHSHHRDHHVQSVLPSSIYGASSETRTHTLQRITDFKSVASTYSAMLAIP